VLPGVQPRLGHDPEPLPPFLVEGFELGLRLVGVDRFEVPGDLFALAAEDVL
jgi:hypothetical protein